MPNDAHYLYYRDAKADIMSLFNSNPPTYITRFPMTTHSASDTTIGAVSGQTRSLLYLRIVVKVGTTLLTGGADHLDLDIMRTLVNQVASLHQAGAQVIVVSSGAVAAGRQVLGTRKNRKGIPYRQVLASVGQGRLVQIYEQLFSEYDISVAQSLLSRRDIANRLGYLNIRNTLEALLELEVVPIVNENDVVAVEELAGEAFGDNDNLSAMVANLIDADLLAMLGEMDGLYTADPRRSSDAKFIQVVERIDRDIEKLASGAWLQGKGGMATKVEAAKLATASGIAVAIASGRQPDVLRRLTSGERVGTFFQPVSSKMESRKRWMLSRLSTTRERGLVIDEGAANALRSQNRSLLAKGIKEVKGPFNRGDIVLLLGPDGEQVACGIANYSFKDIETIKGQHSDMIEKLLGHQYGDEVVHKNNMVLL